MSTSHMRKRAKLGYEECLEIMIESDDREERQLAANKLMMYYAHLRDLEKEVPSTAIIEWWDDLRKELKEFYGILLLDEEGRKKISRGDRTDLATILKRNLERAKLVFSGEKCEILVVTTFDIQAQPAKFYPGQSINYSLARALRVLSDELHEVYGLERLDVPNELFCAETPIDD